MTAQYPISDSRHLTREQRLELFGLHLQVLLDEFSQLREELASDDEQDAEADRDHDDTPSS
ncbi:hypothetical protein D3C84_693980 [compost metagenome]